MQAFPQKDDIGIYHFVYPVFERTWLTAKTFYVISLYTHTQTHTPIGEVNIVIRKIDRKETIFQDVKKKIKPDELVY